MVRNPFDAILSYFRHIFVGFQSNSEIPLHVFKTIHPTTGENYATEDVFKAY